MTLAVMNTNQLKLAESAAEPLTVLHINLYIFTYWNVQGAQLCDHFDKSTRYSSGSLGPRFYNTAPKSFIVQK